MTVSRKQSIIFVLIIALLANGFAWVFSGVAIAHELDHERLVLSLDPALHLGEHHRGTSDGTDDSGDSPDAGTHSVLHAMSHTLGAVLSETRLLMVFANTQVLIAVVPSFMSESVADSPLRPPRNHFAS